MYKAFKLAIKSLFVNPVRTGLTTLGIIIGIATVVLVLSAGEGFKSFINQQIEIYGSNIISVVTRVPPTTRAREGGAVAQATQADQSRALGMAITTLKTRDVEDVKRLPNIVNAYGLTYGQKTVSYKGTIKNPIIVGASEERFEIDKGELVSGRFYTEAENRGAEQVVILGYGIAEDLFETENPIGKMVRVGELNFIVIGVYERKGGFSGEDDQIFMPLNTLHKKLLGIDYLVGIIAQFRDENLVGATAEDMRIVIRNNHNIDDPVKDDFLVMTMDEGMEIFDSILAGVTFLLIAIATISLLVGGVGIMNIMYVVVTERISEIGLKKSLGAKNSDILKEFLIEAVLMTIVGGVIGILVGAFLAYLVAFAASYSGLAWSFVVPVSGIVIGFSVAGGIGLIFGVFPARRAAKLDPVEAMRYE